MPYIYKADFWCDQCGAGICSVLMSEGKKPANALGSWDTGNYPMYVKPAEGSDTPNHCASMEECINAITLSDGSKIGALVTEELTKEGRDYVRQAIEEGGLCAVEVWKEAFE